MAQPAAAQVPTVTPVEAALHFRVLHLDRVEPDRELIHKLAHIQPDRPTHARWVEQVEQLIQELRPLTRPRALFRIDPIVSLEDRRVVLASGAAFEGAVGTFLKNATLIATFVVTIGSAVERLSRIWLRAGKIMQGTIADAIASQCAEATCQTLCRHVRLWAQERACETTPPYSPGYCGMSVRQQIPLFASLPTERINVHRTPSCLMLPVKSISGLIGIGPPDKINPQKHPCEACAHPHCTQRRAPCNHELAANETTQATGD